MDVQGACKRLGEDGRPSKGLADLPKWNGVKYKWLASAPKGPGGFAKDLHSSLRTSADLQMACKSLGKFRRSRKRLARSPTKIFRLSARRRRRRLPAKGRKKRLARAATREWI